ncbi:MAG: Uma2 family endonuclease [Acidobacteriota bacterium]|nr:Uma2 family endonuclease [Acidobacteriota bacterium]
MSALPKNKHNYSLEEYAELEKVSEERLEYFDGNVWSMAGASPVHEEIVANIITELKNNLRGRGCRVFGSNLRVKVPVYKPYRYPDVTALCEQPVYEDFYGLQILTNPALIVEVLSPSTQSFDLTDKFEYYKSIASFTEYLLVAQDRPHVALYTKQDEKSWLHRAFNSLDESVRLSSLRCELRLAEAYLDIEFPEPASPRFPYEHEDFR